MAATETFNAAYYATRNYRDYLSRKFDTLAGDLWRAVPLTPGDSVTDFGCGYGGLLAALAELGMRNLYGTDISQWAIDEGRARFPWLAERLEYYNRNLLTKPCDLMLFLDVLEHMPEYEIENCLKLAARARPRALVVRLPVCASEGEPYVLAVSNNDPTHITCHTKAWWHETLARAGFGDPRPLNCAAIYDSEGVLAARYRPV